MRSRAENLLCSQGFWSRERSQCPIALPTLPKITIGYKIKWMLFFRFTILILIATNLMPMFDPFVVNILMNVSKDDEFPARYTLYTLVRFPLSLVLPLLGALVQRSRAAFDVVVLLSLSLAAFLVTRLPREANLN